MKRKLLFAVVWVIITGILLYTPLVSICEYETISTMDRALAYQTIVNTQKMFLNANIIFGVFLYFNKKLFLEPMQMVRYGKRLFADILLTGVEYALIFVADIYIVLAALAVYFHLQISVGYLTDVSLAFLVSLQMYLLYTLLYIIIEQPAVSLAIEMVSYLSISGVIIASNYAQNETGFPAPVFYHPLPILVIDVLIATALYLVLSKKNFSGKQPS